MQTQPGLCIEPDAGKEDPAGVGGAKSPELDLAGSDRVGQIAFVLNLYHPERLMAKIIKVGSSTRGHL